MSESNEFVSDEKCVESASQCVPKNRALSRLWKKPKSQHFSPIDEKKRSRMQAVCDKLFTQIETQIEKFTSEEKELNENKELYLAAQKLNFKLYDLFTKKSGSDILLAQELPRYLLILKQAIMHGTEFKMEISSSNNALHEQAHAFTALILNLIKFKNAAANAPETYKAAAKEAYKQASKLAVELLTSSPTDIAEVRYLNTIVVSAAAMLGNPEGETKQHLDNALKNSSFKSRSWSLLKLAMVNLLGTVALVSTLGVMGVYVGVAGVAASYGAYQASKSRTGSGLIKSMTALLNPVPTVEKKDEVNSQHLTPALKRTN